MKQISNIFLVLAVSGLTLTFLATISVSTGKPPSLPALILVLQNPSYFRFIYLKLYLL